ncbi:MAG: hypothetical protein HYY62_04315, partial [Deltaproteobacteria bacterium]|nr:hypothetical protein [Deltaproteobacteria bacterium]
KVLATLFPQEEEVLDSIRKLPVAAKTAQNFTRCATSTLVKKEAVKPIAPKRFKVEFSASEELTKKIQRAKEILRHKYPKGNLEDIIDEALELLLEKKDPERKIKRASEKEILRAERPQNDAAVRNDNRYIPQAIQREVYKRDEGQCSYRSSEGKQCGERNFLELDHVWPFALGGDSMPENLRLLCRTHNQWRSERTFGVRQ